MPNIKSAVRDYFSLVEKNTKVKCSKCASVLSYKNSTTNMMYHLKSSHSIEVAKCTPKGGRKKRFPQNAGAGEDNDSAAEDDPESDDGFEPKRKTPSKTPSQVQTIASCVSNMNSFACGNRRDVECTNALAYMIVKDNMPLRTPEKPGFKKFVNTLQPLYKVPSEPTMTRFIEDKYVVLKAKVMLMISKAHSITLTMDLWTHKNTMRNYLGITCCMTKGPKSVRVELGCRVIDERKTIEILQAVFKAFCDEWKIELLKVRAAITDGGINIKNACKLFFGNEKHVNCAAHKFNIIGQKCIGNDANVPSERAVPRPDVPEDEDDGGDVDFDEDAEAGASSLREVLSKVKKTVRFFKQSSNASASLMSLQISEMGKTEATALKLIQEVRTRWNSCHDMISRYLELAPLVSRVVLEMQRNKSTKSKPPAILSAEEEDTLQEVKALLSGLARATKEVCAHHTSISMVIPLVKNLRHDVEKFMPTTGVAFNLKEHLLELIKNEFGRIEEVPIYAIATILDPRFKTVGFYNDESKPRRVANALTLVANLVKQKMREAPQQQEEQRVTTHSSSDDFWTDFDAEAERHTANHAGQDMAGGMPIQLRMYMDRALMCRKAYTHPLQAWEVIKGEYPAVYAVAQEYVSILATSVDAERLFSHAGDIASQERTRLACKHLDMLVFMKSCDEEYWF